MNKESPNQLAFTFGAPTIVAQGDGSYFIRPGKPIEWLTPGEFARQVGLSRDSIYRRIADGSVPREMVEFCGPRKIRIKAQATADFLERFRQQRES